MIAPDDDGGFNLSTLDEMIDSLAEPGAFAVTEPADSGGQSLKLYLLSREVNPSVEHFVFMKELQHQIVRNCDVARVARKRCPPERAASFRKHRPNIGGNKSGEII